MEQQLYEMLRQCTVRVSVPRKIGHGTGFFVAHGLIVTCAHVLEAALSDSLQVEVYWKGQPHPAQITKLQRDQDLALLQVNLLDHPCVYLHEEAMPFDALYSYGYPDDHPNGDPATFSLEGKAGEQGEQFKFKTGQVRPGMSGMPLLNVRTGYVCGVVQLTRDRTSDLGGRAIPASMVFRVFPELVALQQQFHLKDEGWTKLLEKVVHQTRPRDFIPTLRNPLFQARPGEFEELERLLFEQHITRLGLVGMGGVGKTQLAIELVHRWQKEGRFPDGIFWMTPTGNKDNWTRALAELASTTNYLPSDDALANTDNEVRRAQHLCRYLAGHARALLVLDNIDDPSLVESVLPRLAGQEMACTLLYTSRATEKYQRIFTYNVDTFPEEIAFRLLLSSTRQVLLTEILDGSQSDEAQASRSLCQEVGYLPLALEHLRSILYIDQKLTLVKLLSDVKELGVLKVANNSPALDTPSLTACFELSWEKVVTVEAQRLFKLSSFFPVAAPIPLWLLGIAAGLGEQREGYMPLGTALLRLQKLSLLKKYDEDHVWLHPLVHEFGQRLVTEDKSLTKTLREEAAKQLLNRCTDLHWLDGRARNAGYWACLNDIRAMRAYLESLGIQIRSTPIESIERWLSRESYLLANEQWWPDTLPGLFHQQLFNLSVEEGPQLQRGTMTARWLRLMEPVGLENKALLQVFTDNNLRDDTNGFIQSIESVAFSPDNEFILIAYKHGVAKVCETKTGRELATFWSQSDISYIGGGLVTFSPDGKKAFTYSTLAKAQLWDSFTGRELVTLQMEHISSSGKSITAAFFSHDSRCIITVSPNKKIGLWETDSGTLLSTLTDPIEENGWRIFSPDGELVAARLGNTAHIWDALTGHEIAPLEGFMGKDSSVKQSIDVVFSPDNKLVFIYSADNSDIKANVWETNTGKLLYTLPLRRHLDFGTISWSNMGHRGLFHAAFSSDNRLILTAIGGTHESKIHLWEAYSGKLLFTLKGHNSYVACAVFSPDSTQVLTGFADGTVRLWDTGAGRELATLQGHNATVNCINFSSDGKLILTGSLDRTVRLWRAASDKLLSRKQLSTGSISSMAFSPDGRLLLAVSNSYTADLWEAQSGKLLSTLKYHTDIHYNFLNVMTSPHYASISRMAFHPAGGKVLIGYSDGIAKMWETSREKAKAWWWGTKPIAELQGHSGEIESLAFSPDGRLILTGSSDGTVCLWKFESMKAWLGLIRHDKPLVNKSYKDWVRCVAFSPNGKLALTAEGGIIHVWDVMTGNELRNLQEKDTVISVAFSGDSRHILAGYFSGTVRLWEIYSSKLLTTMRGHAEGVSGVAFAPQGDLALTYDRGGRVFFWQTRGADIGRPLGLYVTTHKVGAVYWQDSAHVVLADEGSQGRPNFYRLKLDGKW